jgi:hypothetical protein
MFLKDPNDVKDVSVDFSNLLPTGETLTGAATVTPDSGITVDSNSVATPNVTVRLSGGTIGERYDVNVEIDSSDGETYDRKVVIVCEDL